MKQKLYLRWFVAKKTTNEQTGHNFVRQSELALELFERAEKIEPGFYSKNQIMIAKTLLALNREKDRATNHLKSIVNKYKGSVKWADTEVSFHQQLLNYIQSYVSIISINLKLASNRSVIFSHTF
uniref:Uncharacterized protein n=1 Tax=Tetranychus urticae TaxID=32264 RepID=T1KYI7_TETUR